ncbi:hypothetical protein [Micromonospora sp. WMMD710]|nr:hypothetical protein [Micromonospora sp. WMMD710]MDG4756390.1 hypothetical protein [Micromonospora sp. WMMD710]
MKVHRQGRSQKSLLASTPAHPREQGMKDSAHEVVPDALHCQREHVA